MLCSAACPPGPRTTTRQSERPRSNRKLVLLLLLLLMFASFLSDEAPSDDSESETKRETRSETERRSARGGRCQLRCISGIDPCQFFLGTVRRGMQLQGDTYKGAQSDT
eukprot:715093-Rhodomonas_salina.3